MNLKLRRRLSKLYHLGMQIDKAKTKINEAYNQVN